MSKSDSPIAVSKLWCWYVGGIKYDTFLPTLWPINKEMNGKLLILRINSAVAYYEYCESLESIRLHRLHLPVRSSRHTLDTEFWQKIWLLAVKGLGYYLGPAAS